MTSTRRTLILLAVAAAIAAPSAGAAASGHNHAMPGHATKQVALHDGMRKLWEDHITWTRLAIVSFAAEVPDLSATEARLLANQRDIGNAIKPYFGRKAGNRLTALLREHILGAVELLKAAKSGDQAQIDRAGSAWYANGKQIADFLHGANPRYWGRGEMRSMMKMHLDQTLKEAQDRLGGRYAVDIRDYEVVHEHILEMADELSDGIVKRFPGRFR
jgi:hypothetical protein